MCVCVRMGDKYRCGRVKVRGVGVRGGVCERGKCVYREHTCSIPAAMHHKTISNEIILRVTGPCVQNGMVTCLNQMNVIARTCRPMTSSDPNTSLPVQ